MEHEYSSGIETIPVAALTDKKGQIEQESLCKLLLKKMLFKMKMERTRSEAYC